MIFKKYLFFLSCLLLSSCGFHSQGAVQLTLKLHRLYLQAIDPYSELVRSVKISLKMSQVQITDSPSKADTILVILLDNTSQDLLSVSGTQQTRQYLLKATLIFKIEDQHGHTLVPPETLVESRVITVQSNQVLGTSNEVNLFYKQMRRSLAYALMNRLASIDVTAMVNKNNDQP